MVVKHFERRWHGWILACVLLSAVLALAACGSSSSSSSSNASSGSSSASSGSSGSSGDASTSASLNQAPTAFEASLSSLQGKHVAFLGCATVITWCAKWDPSVVQALKGAGASVTEQLYQSQTNPAQQVGQLQQAITGKPDAIIVEPLAEPALVPQLIRAKAAHIPVVFAGSIVEPSIMKQGLVQTTESVDHFKDGLFAAQALVRGLKAEGKTQGNIIMISGTPDDGGSSLAREAGFKAGLAKYPGFKLVSIADSNWDPTKAAQVTGPLLAKYANQGGVAGIYGIAGYVAVGAIQAAKQAGLKVGVPNKGIVFVGGNCSATSVKALQDGQLYADFTEIPTEEAVITAKATAAVIDGKTVPPVVSPTLNEITKENLSTYASRCNY